MCFAQCITYYDGISISFAYIFSIIHLPWIPHLHKNEFCFLGYFPFCPSFGFFSLALFSPCDIEVLLFDVPLTEEVLLWSLREEIIKQTPLIVLD